MATVAKDKLLYRGKDFNIGLFDCPRQAVDFHNTGPAGGYLLVFPRCPVEITHRDKRPVVADNNSIIFYNLDQEYRRDPISTYGDACLFIAFSPALIIECLADVCPQAIGSDARPFRFVNSLCSAETFIAQNQLTQYLRRQTKVDPLWVESLVLNILTQSLQLACDHWYAKSIRGRPLSRRHHHLTEATKKLLVASLDQKVTLPQLASQLATTPFHLCRVFHRVAGISLHQYINRLRLHASLDLMTQTRQDFTRISNDLGFANPSHFAMAFKKYFASTPSDLKYQLVSAK